MKFLCNLMNAPVWLCWMYKNVGEQSQKNISVNGSKEHWGGLTKKAYR